MIKRKFGLWRLCGEYISFNSTVFLEFLDCTQFFTVLSNVELGRLVTIFLLFNVCSWSLFRALRGLVLSFQIKIEASDKKKNNYSLKYRFKETTD